MLSASLRPRAGCQCETCVAMVVGSLVVRATAPARGKERRYLRRMALHGRYAAQPAPMLAWGNSGARGGVRERLPGVVMQCQELLDGRQTKVRLSDAVSSRAKHHLLPAANHHFTTTNFETRLHKFHNKPSRGDGWTSPNK
ncbi:uncharacterized protein BDZ99DRAFT_155096 [Mytilinidion resinicola]|uniref:Uncharacterized protein n=1 Tax=Mytilinidion resinicola TaxID=574789 RepID=A0A6A6Y6K8_9PEZI|nr:uncharacterized protein BDZ99DRAFT_155096 [Mytilinidion resinicola]KAF2804320.1 hypothetical protein BDZ99DRAFT_155096 [Mytilinidion resinicola]